MKQVFIILSWFVVQTSYSQNCSSEIPHQPCSWEFNACYYKACQSPQYQEARTSPLLYFFKNYTE